MLRQNVPFGEDIFRVVIAWSDKTVNKVLGSGRSFYFPAGGDRHFSFSPLEVRFFVSIF